METEKNKGGRPPKEIDQNQFENLCQMQCTNDEICAWFNVTDKTLSNWCKRTYGKSFSDVYTEKRKLGHISLRRAQFQLAKKSAAMGIWLGKQYLGQKDVIEQNVNSASQIEIIAKEIMGDEDEPK